MATKILPGVTRPDKDGGFESRPGILCMPFAAAGNLTLLAFAALDRRAVRPRLEFRRS